MAAAAKDNISYYLLNRLSDLVICSSCLRRGKVTPVRQIISDRHALTNVCPDCRSQRLPPKATRGAVVTALRQQP
jgi:hypothetical protein